MDKRLKVWWWIFVIIILLQIFKVYCNSYDPTDILNDYRADFDTPSIKILNLSGTRDSIDYPGGTLLVTHYRFESDNPIRIKDRKKYKKVDSVKIMNYLVNVYSKTKVEQYLKFQRKDAICLYLEEKYPVRLSGKEQLVKINTIKKWIVLWSKGNTYFVVRVQEDLMR
ncbi:hypothetical protein H8E88_16800 [candidate division KSB1 bacterium]|nr:hypothetical protein [candidate division KSB1 bacterium]